MQLFRSWVNGLTLTNSVLAQHWLNVLCLLLPNRTRELRSSCSHRNSWISQIFSNFLSQNRMQQWFCWVRSCVKKRLEISHGFHYLQLTTFFLRIRSGILVTIRTPFLLQINSCNPTPCIGYCNQFLQVLTLLSYSFPGFNFFQFWSKVLFFFNPIFYSKERSFNFIRNAFFRASYAKYKILKSHLTFRHIP
jgi:hypothetical protein